MGRNRAVGRALTACILALTVWTALVTAIPATDVYAVSTVPVAGGGEGPYTRAGATALTGAVHRVIDELEAAPEVMSPREVKDLTFRRRILEVRTLMDIHAQAYDRDAIRSYRDAVDLAYERTGAYQDIAVAEKMLGMSVGEETTSDLRNQMEEALVPFRDHAVRQQMLDFLARPLSSPRTGKNLRTPRLWDLGGDVASDSYDGVGNAAVAASGVVRNLQGSDLGVMNILDPEQEAYFHYIRRQFRNVLLIAGMYPAMNDATQDIAPTLDELVDQYGDVNDAFISYRYAQALIGADVNAAGAKVLTEFAKAQDVKNQILDARALDVMADRLYQVRDEHRR